MEHRLDIILKRGQVTLSCAMVAEAWVAFTFAHIGLVNTIDKGIYYSGALALSSLGLAMLPDSTINACIAMRHPLSLWMAWGSRRWTYLATAMAVLLAMWFTPAMVLNGARRNAVLARGHWRYAEGRWAEAIAIYRLARPLNMHAVDNVSEMEWLLSQAGYFDGPIDGIPDRHILAALRRLQRDYGFESTARVDPKTRTVLYGLAYRRALNLGADAAKVPHLLETGCPHPGPSVQPANRFDFGFGRRSAPAVPDYATIRAAVIEFQRAHGLTADGNISWGTLRELGQAERTTERQEPAQTQDQQRLNLCSRDYSALV